jgi:thiazole/oxazole-forming peptide maturase SagD family component
MNGFTDPHIFLLNKLSTWLTISAPKTSEIRKDYYFFNKISSFFNTKCFVIEGFVSSPIFYHNCNLVLKTGNWRLDSSGASKNGNEAFLVSQAELLERASAWLPLDIAKKHDFSYESTLEPTLKKVRSRSLLFFRTKKKSLSELYWGIPQKLVNVSSNGTAGHFDKTLAGIKAWNELIERDAFLVYWLNTISANHIDVSQDKEIASLMESVDKNMFTFHLLDITSDIGIPTCLCVIIYCDRGAKKMFMGSAANFEGRLAVLSAVKEACNVSSWLMKQEPLELPVGYIPFSDPKIGLNTRARFYLDNKGIKRAEFLWSSKEIISLENFGRETKDIATPKEQLTYLKRLFKKRAEKNSAYDVYLYSYKNSLISTFGFKVVRVMCEALYPFYLSENFADPHHPRLKEFAKSKGLESIAILNIFPHPFF